MKQGCTSHCQVANHSSGSPSVFASGSALGFGFGLALGLGVVCCCCGFWRLSDSASDERKPPEPPFGLSSACPFDDRSGRDHGANTVRSCRRDAADEIEASVRDGSYGVQSSGCSSTSERADATECHGVENIGKPNSYRRRNRLKAGILYHIQF